MIMIYDVFYAKKALEVREKNKTGGQGAKKFYMKTSSVMLTLSYIELVHIQQNNYD